MNKILEYLKQLFNKKQSRNTKSQDIDHIVDNSEDVSNLKKPITCPDNMQDYEYKFLMAKINDSSRTILLKKAEIIINNSLEYNKVAYSLSLKPIVFGNETIDPWIFIAAIHNQESSRDVGVFKACLHNGERIIGTGKKTTIVPIGKGPFETWSDAAIDALGENRRLINGKLTTLGAWLEMLEAYNGLGYRKHGVSSPYLWAMTDQYTKGYYAGDHNFQPNLVTDHFGAVAIIKTITQLKRA